MNELVGSSTEPAILLDKGLSLDIDPIVRYYRAVYSF